MSLSRRRLPLLLLATVLVLSAGLLQAAAQSFTPANDAFLRTWERTDYPVAQGPFPRTWMWGPYAFTGGLNEPYSESPGGQRVVQYYDKSRMELTTPSADPSSPWYVTNGLLVNELISGHMQVGNEQFEERQPANVNVAGDADDDAGLTYAAFAAILDQPPAGIGTTIESELTGAPSGSGGPLTWAPNPAFAGYGVTAAVHVPETNHSVASVFWTFMTSSGIVYENGQFVTAPLFLNAYYATGFPITEANWAQVKVGGTEKAVLIQCFERRCLTYTPDNAPEWRVEAGNVGQHYHTWRYGSPTPPPPPPPPSEDVNLEFGKWSLYQPEFSSSTYIEGELWNYGSTTAQDITLVVTARNAAGAVVTSDEALYIRPFLPGGQMTPFSVVFFDVNPSSIASVEWQASFDHYDPDSFFAEFYTDSFDVFGVTWNEDRVVGEVRNTGSTAASLIRVVLIGYKANGDVYAVESAFVNLDVLSPGMTTAFESTLFNEDAPVTWTAWAWGFVED